MFELFSPSEISIKEIQARKSLSPSNFARIDIKNPFKKQLSYFLNGELPYNQGCEPGSVAYVKKSNVSFVRNSCIDSLNYSNIESKEIFLNPLYEYENALINNDVLLCKDANIGDSCLFITEKRHDYVFSSGIVKLNFCCEPLKYYCLSFIRDNYFTSQLDALTPKGSTIRHAGDKFLNCNIPDIKSKEEELLPFIEALVKNIAYSERYSFRNLQRSNEIIEKEIFTSVLQNEECSIKDILESKRIDAGFFSKEVKKIDYNIQNYKKGYLSLEDFGFSLKRGPNLQKRDLGRSIKSDTYRPNYHLLVYPSDISDYGYITKEMYIGAKNSVWYLKQGDILFSAEGTVGKVFVICDEQMKFITNIHGIIISPDKNIKSIEHSIFLGQFLHYLRSKEYLDKISVGGQGGSFAVNYWNKIAIPNIDSSLMGQTAKLYYNKKTLNPFKYSELDLLDAGVFELNNFRILCAEILKKIVDDIKKCKTENILYYQEYFNCKEN